MAKISVIIPTFNRKHTLARALCSVVQQTYQDWDLWLIDDGSSDGTREFFLEWAETNGERHRMNYVYQDHAGVSRARNCGVDLSAAPLVAFLDSDDEWLPHKLELQMDMYESTGLRLIHGDEIWLRQGKKVPIPFKYKKYGGRIFKYCLPLTAISPSTALMERSLFEEMGGFREDFPVCEDYDLWLKICSRYEVGFVEHPVQQRHGGHEDQLSGQVRGMDYYRVIALKNQWNNPALMPEERRHLQAALKEKCQILQVGFKKHGHMDRYEEIRTLQRELGL